MPIIDSISYYRQYIRSFSTTELSSFGALSSQYICNPKVKIIQKLLADAWSHTLTIGCNFMFKNSLLELSKVSYLPGATQE